MCHGGAERQKFALYLHAGRSCADTISGTIAFDGGVTIDLTPAHVDLGGETYIDAATGDFDAANGVTVAPPDIGSASISFNRPIYIEANESRPHTAIFGTFTFDATSVSVSTQDDMFPLVGDGLVQSTVGALALSPAELVINGTYLGSAPSYSGTLSTVPAPAGAWLLLSGLGGLGLFARKRAACSNPTRRRERRLRAAFSLSRASEKKAASMKVAGRFGHSASVVGERPCPRYKSPETTGGSV